MVRKYIVTGGLGALGRAVCTQLAADGHRVTAIDLMQGAGAEPFDVLGGIDMLDEAAVTEAYSAATAAMGGLDGVVNVAGGFLWETVAGGASANWDKMYAMNVKTAVISSRVALSSLSAGGAIVNVGAAAASGVNAGMAPYAASKAGVMALTEGLAEELLGTVRVNAVLPTIIDTPTNRKDMPDADHSTWVSPEAAAKAIAFLLSHDARAITGVGIKLSVGG